MAKRDDLAIQNDIEALLLSAGLPLVVEVSNGVVRLEGIVLSEAERDAALDLVDYVAGVDRIVDDLEVADIEEESPDILFVSVSGPVETTSDPMQAAEEGLPYFPPTDPPTIPGRGPDEVAIADGFAPSAMEGDLDTDDEGYIYRDAEIIDIVVRELADDAATSHLDLYVSSLGGVVVLSGTVSDQLDADAAVEVVERVEGVDEVVNRLIVSESEEVLPTAPRPFSRVTPMSHVMAPSASWRATVIANQFRLRDRRETVVEEIAHLERDLASYGIDQASEGHGSSHDADIATDVQSAETIIAELNGLKHELQEIDDALQAAREGRYGIDVDTGELIDPARLRAYPLARRNIESQRHFELRGGM